MHDVVTDFAEAAQFVDGVTKSSDPDHTDSDTVRTTATHTHAPPFPHTHTCMGPERP